MDSQASPDRVVLANQIFSDAIELPAPERLDFVSKKCATDPSLYASVRMLLSQYERLGSFLEAPAFHSGPAPGGGFEPGETLGNRFRILQAVGSGGMGDVYSATDLELGETVALKALRSNLRADSYVAGRFREELRLARKIGHPNVCRIFDLYVEHRSDDEVSYFTMEYLAGETLARRLGAGRLQPEAALDIARQIAAGLDAAHALGIVHRDLKPANIMLVPREGGGVRAVIMDFGLAKAFATDDVRPGRTETGRIAGTPEYMAPEQFLGTEITSATDVYALGLIVFEAVAGRRPFPEESIIRAAVRRSVDRPPSLRQMAPGMPARWDGVLRRALDTTPARRPASAGQLIAELESGRNPSTVIRLALSQPIPRRTWLWTAAGGTVLAASYSAFRLWNRKPLIGSSEIAPLLMLTPLAHSANSLDGASVGVLLGSQLQQSGRLSLLDQDRVQAGWKLIRGDSKQPLPTTLPARVARHIALVEGANLVLFGNVSQVGDDWTIDLRLELVHGSPDQAEAWRNETFHDSNVSTATVRAANWVRRTVSEPELQLKERSRRPEELTTRNWHALQQYVTGNDAYLKGNNKEAIDRWQEALTEDPEFAIAAASLGDILTGMGHPDEGLPYHEQAERILIERGLTDRESLRIRGMFALDSGRFAEAEQVFALFAENFPRDTAPLLHRATALDRLGRAEEAEKLLDIAIARDPKSYTLIFRRAHLLLDAGRLDDAERDANTAAAIAANDWTDQLRSAIAFSRSDFRGVAKYVDRMRSAGSDRFKSRAFSFQACFLADQGKLAEAEQSLRDGIAFDLRTGTTAESQLRKRCQLAQLTILAGRLDEARKECLSALQVSTGIETTLQIAGVLARAGNVAAAEAHLPAAAPKWPTQQYWFSRLRGELALARGDARTALREMEQPSAQHTSGEFPAMILRAAQLAGDSNLADSLLMSLLTNPGRYWFQANTSEPGFVRLALEIADARRFTPTQAQAGARLRALTTFFLRR